MFNFTFNNIFEVIKALVLLEEHSLCPQIYTKYAIIWSQNYSSCMNEVAKCRLMNFEYIAVVLGILYEVLRSGLYGYLALRRWQYRRLNCFSNCHAIWRRSSLHKVVENKCECSEIRLRDDPTLLRGANEFPPARSVFLDRFGWNSV